jgi:hypothetical protein
MRSLSRAAAPLVLFVPVAVSVSLALAACAPAPVTPAAVQSAPAEPGSSRASSPAAPLPPAPSNAAVPPAPSASIAPAPAPSSTPPATLPAGFEQALDDASKAIAARDTASADKQLAAASAMAGDDAHLAYLVAHLRATRFVYSGEFDRAASAFLAVIPALAAHPELGDEFWSHNAMMMIREAQGDPAAALVENDQATLSAARGTWGAQDRDTLAFQKDRWHRAYLTRMLAESRAGSVKEGLVRYAQAALDEYRAHGGFPESVAVLDAYFAALDGKRAEALAAARRVDPAKDDDVEDLYLVAVGLEAGGDRSGAEAVRRRMRQAGPAHIARAIMLRWLDLDARGTGAHGFTPWHAGAR